MADEPWESLPSLGGPGVGNVDLLDEATVGQDYGLHRPKDGLRASRI